MIGTVTPPTLSETAGYMALCAAFILFSLWDMRRLRGWRDRLGPVGYGLYRVMGYASLVVSACMLAGLSVRMVYLLTRL